MIKLKVKKIIIRVLELDRKNIRDFDGEFDVVILG